MTDDVDRIMAVMAAAFDPVYGEAWNRRQVEDALLLTSTHYHLANAEGAPAGPGEPAAGFWMSRHGYEEEELLLLAVLPDYRGRGVAASMLEELRRTATRRGAHRLLLEMRKGNPAESLYRRFGFYVIGERREYYRTPGGNRLDAVTFAYDIRTDTLAQIEQHT